MRKRMFVGLVVLSISGLAFADIVIKPDGTWDCDKCAITYLGGGKIKVCTTDPKTGSQFCATLDTKDLGQAEPSKPGPDTPGK